MSHALRTALDHLLQCRAELRLVKAQARGTPREAEIAAVLDALRRPTETLAALTNDQELKPWQ